MLFFESGRSFGSLPITPLFMDSDSKCECDSDSDSDKCDSAF